MHARFIKTFVPTWRFHLSFITSFCLQIPYRNVRKFQFGAEKLVETVMINLLCHVKQATCIISIIIDLLSNAFMCTLVASLHCRLLHIMQSCSCLIV